LAQQHRVRVVDALLFGGRSLLGVWSHPDFEFCRADIREQESIRTALTDIDAVVHLAAMVGDPACARNPKKALEVNLEASIQLLEESRRVGIKRFVFASTCSNYGRGEDSEKYLDETAPLRPLSLYAETKVSFEQKLLESNASNGFCGTSLRFATLFGVSPRMRFDLTVNEFTMELLTKKRLVVFGEQFWRPYVHVRDAAHAIGLVLAADPEEIKGRTFNVGSTSQNYRKKELVELIRSYEPIAVIEYVRRDEDPRDYRVSFTRIKEQLNFLPRYTVPDGIGEVVQLIRSSAICDYSDPFYYNIPRA